MSGTLTPGLNHGTRIAVDQGRTIAFMGEDCRVYATPSLGWDVEVACRDLVLGQLAPGEDTVGSYLEIEHVGAALLGAEVSIAVTLTAVDGRKLDYSWTVHEGDALVAKGRHQRVVVDKAKLAARLRAKRG